MKRLFNKRQKNILLLRGGNKCAICGKTLSNDFHADHVKAFSKGGKTITQNGQLLCPKCNLKKGNKDA